MDGVSQGYLAHVEASAVGVRPGPEVVYVRLMRGTRSGARPTTSMFVELTPGEALKLAEDLEACVRTALAVQ